MHRADGTDQRNQGAGGAGAGGGEWILTLDRGNSTLDCRLRGPGVSDRRRLDPDTPDLADRLGELLAGRRPLRIAALTVVDAGLDAASRALDRLGADATVLRAAHELPCPLRLEVDPATLGVDRWVGALAAHRRHGAAVTIDCGTAVTVNLVTADGRFLGGAIAPGARTMARALRAAAPALPEAMLDVSAPVELPARATPAAVELGVAVGFAGLVESLVDRLAEATGLGAAVCVVTGGEAPLLLRHGRGRLARSVEEPELVHEGLAALLCAHGSRS